MHWTMPNKPVLMSGLVRKQRLETMVAKTIAGLRNSR